MIFESNITLAPDGMWELGQCLVLTEVGIANGEPFMLTDKTSAGRSRGDPSSRKKHNTCTSQKPISFFIYNSSSSFAYCSLSLYLKRYIGTHPKNTTSPTTPKKTTKFAVEHTRHGPYRKQQRYKRQGMHVYMEVWEWVCSGFRKVQEVYQIIAWW